jgi:hypothetical protein
MMKNIYLVITFFFLHTQLFGSMYFGPHIFSAAPEICYNERERTNSKISGYTFGGTLQYERMYKNSLYAHLHGSYLSGTLNGSTTTGLPLASNYFEKEWQGRLGYTFSFFSNSLWLTPYAGYGTLITTNQFKDPTPLHFCFTDRTDYYALGLNFSTHLKNSFFLKADFNYKKVDEGACDIKNDPIYDHVDLVIGETQFFYGELAVYYSPLCKGQSYEISLYYNRRDYGGKENFPLDFIQTRYNIHGLKLLFNQRF